MTNFHPDTRVLNDYSAGSLPLAQSVCVSMHLDYCDHCQRQTKQLQQLGAGMFERLSPEPVQDDLLGSVLARLDDAPPLSYSTTMEPLDVDSHPTLLKRLMHKDYDDLEWKSIGSDLQISHLKTGDPRHEMALYHIKAGGSIPEHTHRGSELTLVLEGSFSDEEGVYQQGDFLMRDADHVHTPTAAQSADCICIGVLDAPIRFTRWNYRPLNPFLRLHAQ